MIDWQLIDWLIDWQLIDWLIDNWLIDWLIYWLIDWLTRLSNVSSQSGGDSISSSRQSHHSSNSSLGDRSPFFCFFTVMPFFCDKRGYFIVTREAIFLRQEMPFYLIREAIFLRLKRCHFIEIIDAILLRQDMPYYSDNLYFWDKRDLITVTNYFLEQIFLWIAYFRDAIFLSVFFCHIF